MVVKVDAQPSDALDAARDRVVDVEQLHVEEDALAGARPAPAISASPPAKTSCMPIL